MNAEILGDSPALLAAHGFLENGEDIFQLGRHEVAAALDELRVRKDNPARDVAGPDRGAATGKQYLWPSEFQRLPRPLQLHCWRSPE